MWASCVYPLYCNWYQICSLIGYYKLHRSCWRGMVMLVEPCTVGLFFFRMDFISVNWHAHMKIKLKRKFLRYTILYVHMPYYTKIKSKCKFKIRNIKLSKISLPTIFRFVTGIKIESKFQCSLTQKKHHLTSDFWPVLVNCDGLLRFVRYLGYFWF